MTAASADADLVKSSLAQRVMSQMGAAATHSGADGEWRSSSKHASHSQEGRRRDAERTQPPVKVEPAVPRVEENSAPPVALLKKSAEESTPPATASNADDIEIVISDGSSAPDAETEKEPTLTNDESQARKTPSPPPRPLVSSLDKAQLLMAEARKLRKRRRKAAAAAAAAASSGGKGSAAMTSTTATKAPSAETEDDEEEEEGEADREELEELMKELEELDEWRRARCSLVTVWPKKYDDNEDVEQDENKMQYITALGLRTKRAAAEARWEKRVRSKRLRREASVSPLIVEEDTFDESKKGGPLWDDVSLSLLESELRGGMDLTNGIPPVAPADLARVKQMGAEGFMQGLGLRPKRRRQTTDPQPSSTTDVSPPESQRSPAEVDLLQPVAAAATSSSKPVPAHSGAAVEGEEESDGFAPSSVPPVISIDDDESPASAAGSPALASSGAAAKSAEKSGDGAAGSFGGKATKPLFTTSTKHDEKMNEFAREFHQSVLQTTRQQLGQLSPSTPLVRDDTLKSSQEQGADLTRDQWDSMECARTLFSSPATDECWRKFLESYAEYLKGIRSLSPENVSAKIVEEERKVDMVTRILKETMTGIFHSRHTEPSAD